MKCVTYFLTLEQTDNTKKYLTSSYYLYSNALHIFTESVPLN